MNETDGPSGEPASPIERFIKDFFGQGNIVWPEQDPDSDAGRNVRPYLDVIWHREATEVPVVLPRRRERGGDLTAYVIARDHALAAVVADLLTAFVGPSYSRFDGLPARLDPADPVDRAVLDLVGEGLTFTVSSPTRKTQADAWRALDLLQDTLRQRPVRTWHIRKPVGRLLGEFEAALAAGDNFASGDLLDQITAAGGLSPVNLTNLKIKRLARLGLDAELLRLPGLTDVVRTRPPAPIMDAILTAVYGTALAVPVAAGDLQRARQNLLIEGTIVAPLLQGGSVALDRFSGEALAVSALAADILGDARLLAAVLDDPCCRELMARVAPELARVLTPVPEPESERQPEPTPKPEPEPEPGPTAPGSWLDLVAALSAGGADLSSVLASRDWQEWSPPASDDQEIAAVLAGLGDGAADRAWLLAGPLIDADGYERPAARTARQLIEIALIGGRFSPGDLAGLVALAEIYLRSGPDATDYSRLLGDLADYSSRWAGPDRAIVVLDLVDLLVRAACPDAGARLQLALALLRPLRDQDGRLEPEQAQFARQLSRELRVGLEWPTREYAGPDESLPEIPLAQVLLYSLDEGVLDRTKALLASSVPSADVRLAHDKVGSPTLRELARHADVIVLATRCAKHAATGFIRQHAARTSVIAEADGSGSASLLRAATTALRSYAGQ